MPVLCPMANHPQPPKKITLTAPPPPNILSVSQTRPDTVELTWQQHRSYFDITGYVISRCRIYTIDTVTTTIGAMETSLSITGLTPGVTYIFTVRAMSKTLRSGPSKPIQVTLEENVEVQSSQWWAWHQVCLVGVVIFCMVCVVRRRGSIARECSNCHRRCIIS
ncbi:hypothetical protein GBAR_LOCUS9594 [Geodia barretti]|uniref:Fibronectin type-III domain-containing protein n=1 Tax=Geodia barretti TaxID=519541 RepID=A0AA35RRF9_GEOBA|nr:hypothetical protein GBAR_LOCUS9594 [Geodia barretti]